MSLPASGLAVVHFALPVLAKQVQWTVARTLDCQVFLDWTPQAAIVGGLRTEFSWVGTAGDGARLTSALAGWQSLYFEVTQDPSANHSGSRWCYTPTLGISHSTIDEFGNSVLGEDQVRAAMSRCGSNASALVAELKNLLAEPWDQQLEPLRSANADSRVIWLHRAG